MTNEFTTLCDQVERANTTVLDNLSETETAVHELQERVAGLPFFVRGFVSSEVSRGSGQDIPAWAATIGALTGSLREAQDAVQRVRTAGMASDTDRALFAKAAEQVNDAQPRFDKLASFMEAAPSRLSSVPAGLLPTNQRDEFLSAVTQQARALRSALAAMPALARGLIDLSS